MRHAHRHGEPAGPHGRVNSYMFQYGGDISTLCNDYVVAHEMGHNVGRLADEYTEYQEFYAAPRVRRGTSLPWWTRGIFPGGT